ncbi:unnamed protein product [Rodentolepis nana]|uniref:VHS domain-containing protein n=1 Tax=Rodentolepis nana TaxID=102285 RepID=A0A0R3TLF8_RODNA|nr:unnamed protein product [Rodentolepis nana]
MARYKDIFDSIVHATSIDCKNRLLAFTKVRNIIIQDVTAARTASRQIINRVRNTALENYKIGLWSLDLLQMCTLHGGENFALSLNSQDQLNELLHFFLIPEKSKAVSTQIQMKINSLLRTWAIAYKDRFSTNNFEYVYGRLKRINMTANMDNLLYSHWLPDKDVFGSPIEDTLYNLQEVFIEISNENKRLYAELQSFFKMASDEKNKGLKMDGVIQKRFKEAQQRTDEIKHMVANSQAFWHDLFEHLADKPSEYREVGSNAQKVFESMDKAINVCELALQLEEETQQKLSSMALNMKNASNEQRNGIAKESYAQPYTPLTLSDATPTFDLENGSEPIPPWRNGPSGLTSKEKIMLAAQTQTDVKEEPKPQLHRLQARSINVQCIDCKVMFSNLDKLLSHPCPPPSWKKPEIKQSVKSNIIPSEQPEQHKPPPLNVPEVTEPSRENAEKSFVCEVCNLEFEEIDSLESHRLTPRHLFSVRRSTAGSVNLLNDIQADTKKPSMKPHTVQPEMPNYLPRKPFSENNLNFRKKELPENFEMPLVETCRNEVKEEVPNSDFDSIVASRSQECPVVPEKMGTWKLSSLKETNQIENYDQRQSSQEDKKYVVSNDSMFNDSMENSGGTPYMEVIQPLPELPLRSSLPDGISEKMAEKEVIKERPPSSIMETGDNISKYPQMPKLPQFSQVEPIVKDGKYVAVFVPASQLVEPETIAGPIFTRSVSVSD